MPVACAPEYGAEEIGGGFVCCILPVVEDLAQVEVALSPRSGIYVVDTTDAHEVVKVDFVCSLVLLLCEVQFVSHLVGKEQCLLSGLWICHSLCA